MLSFTPTPHFPEKCPYTGCKTKIKKDWILGVIPRCPSEGSADVNVILRCHKCKRTFGFGMPAVIVHRFIDSLPDGKGLIRRRIDPRKVEEPLSSEEAKKLEELLKGSDIIDSFRLADEDQEMFGYYDEEDVDEDDEDE